jgi:hypothetical protein
MELQHICNYEWSTGPQLKGVCYFDIVDFSVYFEGLCQQCKKRSPKSIGSMGSSRKQSDNPIKRNLKKENNYG